MLAATKSGDASHWRKTLKYKLWSHTESFAANVTSGSCFTKEKGIVSLTGENTNRECLMAISYIPKVCIKRTCQLTFLNLEAQVNTEMVTPMTSHWETPFSTNMFIRPTNLLLVYMFHSDHSIPTPSHCQRLHRLTRRNLLPIRQCS